MTDANNSEALVAALKSAAAMEMQNPEDILGWERQAEAIRCMLNDNEGLANSAPHIVWHYLDDADIRRKDPAYRAAQVKRLLDVLAIPF